MDTLKIEELLAELKREFTVVIITHNRQQTRRCSDRTAFFLLGRLSECAPTSQIFEDPGEAQTAAYISGKFP